MPPVTSTLLAGNGRLRVRRILASMSRSTTLLIALAPPADSAPPITVSTTSRVSGHPPWAITMAGTVVMSSNSTMRGFVRAT